MGKGKKKRKQWQVGEEEPVAQVPHPDNMNDETFVKHIEFRHGQECKVETGTMSRRAMSAWIGTYRAFHARLHQIAAPGQYNHEHDDWEDE